MFEAGILPDARSLDLVEHVSTCGACGDLLTGLRGGSAEANDTMLLKSSTVEWKRRMLKQIAEQQSADRHFRFSPAWIGVAAAVVTVIAGGAWWMNRVNSPEEAFRLLAQAYSQQRPFELRIPGAVHSPVRVQRGGAFKTPLELVEAESRIARKLQDRPNDPCWLRAQARADLLQSHYAAAIESLRKAQDSEPSNADSWGDLGLAYLQRAEVESRPQDTAQAIEFLTKALEIRPGDAALHFNRALAYERLPALQSAVDEWNRFLQLERAGGWADEAREHLKRTQERMGARAERDKTPGGSEGAIPALIAQGLSASFALDTASIAQDLARNHQDTWMREFLAFQTSARSREAWKTLAEASRNASRGDSTAAVALSQRAARKFQTDGNLPGVAFAAFEEAYGRQRLLEAGCDQTARRALAQAHARKYRWLEVQSELTAASCMEVQQNPSGAYAADLAAQRSADEANYQTLSLRVLGFRAALLRRIGSYNEAIRLDSVGLHRYWDGEGDLFRAYQFSYDFSVNESALEHPHAAAALMREAVGWAALQGDRSVEAMVRSEYGDLLLEEHRPVDAKAEFDRAEELFRKASGPASLGLYRAFAQISRARLDAEENHVAAGLDRLAQMESLLPSLRNSVVEARLWRTKSDLMARGGRLQESDELLGRVLTLKSSTPLAAARAGDPSALEQQVKEAVRILVSHQLDRGAQEGALRQWESYNASFRSVPRLKPETAKLTYAVLPTGPVVWMEDTAGVKFLRLAVSDVQLTRTSMSFRHAVSDSQSPIEPVRALGRQLYTQLVSPIRPWIAEKRVLYISAEGPIDSIPFDALIAEDGVWFGDRYRIVYSPPLSGGHPPHADSVKPESRLFAASYGGGAQVLQAVLSPIPGVEDDAQFAAQAFSKRDILAGDQSTPSEVLRRLSGAAVFHFSGHAIVTASDAALVLAPDKSSASSDRLLWASRLRGDLTRHCLLVVLAACSTARPADDDGDSSSVMARAFLLAGVPEVVAARWDVESQATTALLRTFYRRLGEGASVAEALADSRKALRGQARFAHPYYWAAFDDFCS